MISVAGSCAEAAVMPAIMAAIEPPSINFLARYSMVPPAQGYLLFDGVLKRYADPALLFIRCRFLSGYGPDEERNTSLQSGHLAANAIVSQVRFGNDAAEKSCRVAKWTREGA